jgi:hypothetical protein
MGECDGLGSSKMDEQKRTTEIAVAAHPSRVTTSLKRVNNKICENHQLTISELWTRFPQISRTLFYEIVAGRLHYHKVCAQWVPKMLTGE